MLRSLALAATLLFVIPSFSFADEYTKTAEVNLTRISHPMEAVCNMMIKQTAKTLCPGVCSKACKPNKAKKKQTKVLETPSCKLNGNNWEPDGKAKCKCVCSGKPPTLPILLLELNDGDLTLPDYIFDILAELALEQGQL